MAQTKKIRLDEILVQEGMITQDQIKDALLRQKMQGGKFGSQLLYHRYIDETTLVKALAKQYNCDGVILSDVVVPESVVKLIPLKLAQNRKIMPFEYSTADNTLKIACADPSDMGLMGEISFVVPGKKIKLYVAAELAIETAISKFYLGRKVNLQDSLLLEIPDDYVEIKDDIVETKKAVRDKIAKRKAILLITDEEFAGPLVQSILERDGYEVILCESGDEVMLLTERKTFHTVLIKDSAYDKNSDIINKIRKDSPSAAIRFFKNIASLVINNDEINSIDDIFKRNLDLFLSLLHSKDNIQSSHSSAVGHYADRLCRKLGLSPKDRLLIVNAGYLHDLARFYYGDAPTTDNRAIIERSRKLLESLDYTPEVTGLLASMYRNLEEGQRAGMAFEVLGGNILTVVDMFCENLPSDRRLTLDMFDAFKKRIRDYTGKLFLVEVVEPFIGLVQDEILNIHTGGPVGNIMVFSEDVELSRPLEFRLQSEGFSLVAEHSLDKLADLCRRSLPDLLLLLVKGNESAISDFLNSLIAKQIEFKSVPTFLLINGCEPAKLAGFFDKGIEDIVSNTANYDLLMVKLHKLITRAHRQSKQSNSQQNSGGTKGRLADMSLIDLLQALAPGRKTAKITLQENEAASEKLVIYLNKGNIVFAQMGNLSGAEAIYQAMAWVNGVWTIEPIAESNIPQPNNQLSNDAILMEGAYRLDEKMKAGHL
jgi:response regulator RpfG family c-di-GMP phosphodiesterase